MKNYLILSSDHITIEQIIKNIIQENNLSYDNVIKYDMNESLIETAIYELDTYGFFVEQKIVVLSSCDFLTGDKKRTILSQNESVLEEYINNPNELIRGVPSLIEEPIRFNAKTIVLVGTEMDLRENIQENDLLVNNYQADTLPFTKWYFKYNTEARNVNIVTDKTVFETISPFATVNYSARNYKTGTITAFLGSYHKDEFNADWTYKDSIRLQNKFQEFANNGKIKMLRDEIGNVIPVDITLKSFEYNTHTIPTNITVSFEWTQIDTEKNLTVFEVDNEINIQ